MRVLFVGTSDLGIPTLDALAGQGRHEVSVITKPDALAGRGRRLSEPPVKRAAARLGLNISQPRDINGPEGVAAARAFSPHVILVASFAAKISEAFLDLAPHRGINIHPSLLPKYRGAAPVANAILNGDGVTGVSIIRVAPRMDAGDVLGRVEVPIGPRETAGGLEARLARIAPDLVITVLDELERGTAKPVPQDEARVVPAPRFKKTDGLVDWTRPAVEIDRFVRAMTPWPGAHTFLESGGKRVRLNVLEALPAGDPDGRPAAGALLDRDGRLVVACGPGALEVLRVQREGKKPASGAEFLRGVRIDYSAAPACGPGD